MRRGGPDEPAGQTIDRLRLQHGLLALAIAPLHSPARAQSADLVLCDRVAADPGDPDKPKDVKGIVAIAPSDIPIAIKYCRLAAASSRRALYELGRAYAASRQMPEAAGAYRRAADKGSTSAMVELGVMLGTGTGVAKDEAQARKLFERAAKGGNARAVANLAALSGGGASSDPVEARALLAKAAEANSAEAQFQLGLMMAEGSGGPKDDVAARACFAKAAAQGQCRGHALDGRVRPDRARAGRRTQALPKLFTRKPRRSVMKKPRRASSASSVPTCSKTSAAT